MRISRVVHFYVTPRRSGVGVSGQHLASRGGGEKAAFGRSFSLICMSHAFNPTSHYSQNGQIRSVVRPNFKLNAGRRERERKMPRERRQ